MAGEVFVDAGAWIAISDAGDQYHAAARIAQERLLREARALVTTNLVVGEAYVLVRKHAGQPRAMRFLEALRHSSRLLRIYSDADLEEEAEDILRHYADQDFGLTDAVSFAVMRRRQIAEAFAFDHHFLAAGFTLIPAR